MIRSMLVDDEEPARVRLRGMLAPFEDIVVVEEARDGEQALSRITELRPDLVFLDIQMPGLDGLQVAAALSPPRPHIIFCTAFDQFAIEAFEQHALGYLLKPLSSSRLAQAVERARAVVGARQQLAAATRAQSLLLPQLEASGWSLDCSGVCRPALDLGGDYYDFIPVAAQRLGLAVADVAGKGLPAGLLAASLQARLQSLAPVWGEQLEPMMVEINRLLFATTDSNRYATLFYGVYNGATQVLSYINAGHVPPLLFRGSEASPRATLLARLETGGPALGMLSDASYRQGSVQLRRGDLLLCFSDGVLETVGQSGEEFGEERLLRLVELHGGERPAQLRDLVLDEIDRFRGRELTPRDDLTLVAARVR